jgi:DNA phosphorothioation-associated putative methyltransferase
LRAKLYRDVDAADLVKIHIRSGKLTLLFYNNFESSPLPKLRERIKINMRSQKIDFFDHSRDDEQQLLFMKSRYMAPDQEGYERQKTFDDALEKLRLFDFDLSQFGPPTGVFTAAVANAGYSINGFTIAARSERLRELSHVASK